MNIKDVMDLDLGPNQNIFMKLDHTGDERIEWDSSRPESVALAKEIFERYRAKGYVAYRVESSKDDPQGRRGEVLRAFDETARRTIFRPPMRGGLCRE